MPLNIREENLSDLITAMRAGGSGAQEVNAAQAGGQQGLENVMKSDTMDLEQRKQVLMEAARKAQEERLTKSFSDKLGLDTRKQTEVERRNRAMEDILRNKAAADKGKSATKGKELQAKSMLYVGQAIPANSLIEQLEKTQIGLTDQVPGVPERFRSQERKQFEGAALRFATAVLRPETGAQANESEVKDTVKRFIPQSGDGPDVLLQKQAARKTFINLLSAIAKGDTDAANRLDQLIATPTTLARAARNQEAETAAAPALPAAPAAPAGGVDLSSMSDADLDALEQRLLNGQ